ncbi:AI-2E family transporter, partial [Chloroflexota bacterium]
MNTVDIRTRVFFFLTLLVLLILAILVLKPFFTTIVFTIILIIILKPAYNYILNLNLIKGRKRLAATITLILFVVVLFIPLFLIFQYTVFQLSDLTAQMEGLDIEAIVQDIEGFLGELNISIDPESLIDNLVNVSQTLIAVLGSLVVNLISSIPSLLLDGIIFLVLFITLLPEYDNVVGRFQE